MYMTWLCKYLFHVFLSLVVALCHQQSSTLQEQSEIHICLCLAPAENKEKLQNRKLIRTTALSIWLGTHWSSSKYCYIVYSYVFYKIPTVFKDWPNRAGFQTHGGDKELSIWTGSCLGCTHASSKVIEAVTRLLTARLECTLKPLGAKNTLLLIVVFCQEHPTCKWDQNPLFIVLSETKSDEHLSCLLIREPPPPLPGETLSHL